MKKRATLPFCLICAAFFRKTLVAQPFLLTFLAPLLATFLATASAAERINVGDGGDPAVSVLQSDSRRIVLEFTLGGFDKTDVTVNGQTYSRITLPGEGLILERGLPELPLVARGVIIPDDRDMRLRVVTAETADLPGIDVVPSKGNLLRTVDPDDVPYTFGPFYTGDGWYPEAQAFAAEPYILRDYRGTTVVAQPFSYQPSTHTLRVVTRLVVELLDAGPGGANPLNRAGSTSVLAPEFAEIYQTRFVNYNEQPRYTMVLETGSMLVIVYDAFAANMQPFVDWKNQMGLPTTMVPVSQIGNTADQIKAYIQNAYDQSSDPKLAFVLLVGDAAQVATPIIESGGADPTYGLVAGADQYPDIFIGRFSAETPEQVDTQVLRTVNYEKDPLLAGTDWYAKGTGIGSTEGPGAGGELDWEHIDVIRTKLINYGYTLVDQLYDPGVTSAMISEALNDGRSIVNYCGHGGVIGWSTGYFIRPNVFALHNDNKLPFIFSVACQVGFFNGATCFGEAWLRATHNGNPTGAIGAYMSSTPQSWNPPMVAQDEAIRLLTQDLARTYGSLCFNGCCWMLQCYQTGGPLVFNTWIIFGDPSLRVRTKPPQPMEVSAPSTIAADASTFPVDVPGQNANVLCGLSYQGQYLGSGFTDSNGHAVIGIVEALPEGQSITLTATAYNRIPWIGQVFVEPLPVPAIACDPDSFEVTLGLGSQLVDTLTITNVGQPGSVLDFVARFTSGESEPWVVLEPAEGSIPAGQSAQVLVTFDSGSLPQGNYGGRILIDHDPSGTYEIPALLHVQDETSATEDRVSSPTLRLAIAGANPSFSSTVLRFSLPAAQPARVTVFDAAGRLVRVLRQGPASEGEHVVTWDGRDSRGRMAAPGVYFTRLSTAEGELTVMVLRVE